VSLFDAIQSADPVAVTAAIAAGADPNAADDKGLRPMVAAIRLGDPAVMRALIAGGLDVNALSHGRSALSLACAFRFLRGLYPDQVAAWAPAYEQITADLLAAGADPRRHAGEARWLPIAAACTHGTAAQVAMLLQAGVKLPLGAIGEAVSNRSFALVEAVLDEVPRKRRPELLRRLALAGDDSAAAVSLARALIAGGADPVAADDAGATPLHAAAYWLSAAVIGVLVGAGASLDAATTGRWIPEDSPKPKGTTPRGLLDANLRVMVEEDGASVLDDPQWLALAAAIGVELPAWIARLNRPADDPSGRWVATLAVIDVDGVDVDVLPDDPPVLELGADGRFALTGGDGALPEGGGAWSEAKLTPKAKKALKKASPPLELVFDGEHAGVTWRMSRSQPGALVVDVETDRGDDVTDARWTFQRQA
jgi:ankyrin repeat protein